MPRVSIAKPDQRSAAALEYRKLYFTKEWRTLRARRLKAEPYCRTCARMGRQTLATVVDHTRPHRGNVSAFFDYVNTQSLCPVHHSASKQRTERGGVTRVAVGADGWPIA